MIRLELVHKPTPAVMSDVIIVVKIGLSAKRGLCHDQQIRRRKC